MNEGDREVPQSGHNLWALAGAERRTIFLKRDITDIMGGVFNGIIANDKFCMSRMKPFQISPARKLEAHEVQYPSQTSTGEGLSEEESNEKTAVESSAFGRRDNRRQAPMESSLSVSRSMECDDTTRKPTKPFRKGVQR